MKPLFEEIEFSPNALAWAVTQGEATNEEIFELIKELDRLAQDWDFTIQLARFFCKQVAQEYAFLVTECNEDLEFINLEKL